MLSALLAALQRRTGPGQRALLSLLSSLLLSPLHCFLFLLPSSLSTHFIKN